MPTNKRYTQITIENSRRCNLRCVMCPTTIFKEEDKGFMSDEVFENIFPFLEGVGWVHIGAAGEPFLDKKLFSRIAKIKEKGCFPSAVTHGGLLDEEKIDKVFQYGLDRIIFSFDAATKETYEEIRIGSSYEKVIENIKKLIQEKNKRRSSLKVCFNYTVMRKNIKEIPLFVDMALELGVDVVAFIGLISTVELNNSYEKCESDKLLTAIQEARIRLNGRIYTLNIEKDFSFPRCPLVPQEMLFIDYEGNVYPCCTLSIVKPFGNVLFEPLPKIWEKEEYARFRDMWENAQIPEDCKHCDYINK